MEEVEEEVEEVEEVDAEVEVLGRGGLCVCSVCVCVCASGKDHGGLLERAQRGER